MTKEAKRLQSKADELRAELKRLTERREALTAETEEAKAALEEAQSAFINGDAAAGDEAAQVQALVTSHGATLDALDHRAESVQEQLEQTRHAIDVEASKEEMLRLSKEAAAAKEEYEAAYVALGEHLDALVPKMHRALKTWRGKAKAVDALLGKLETDDEALFEEIATRGGHPHAVREQSATRYGTPKARYTPPEAGARTHIIEEALRSDALKEEPTAASEAPSARRRAPLRSPGAYRHRRVRFLTPLKSHAANVHHRSAPAAGRDRRGARCRNAVP